MLTMVSTFALAIRTKTPLPKTRSIWGRQVLRLRDPRAAGRETTRLRTFDASSVAMTAFASEMHIRSDGPCLQAAVGSWLV